jgi:hypothetical protein
MEGKKSDRVHVFILIACRELIEYILMGKLQLS